jgi:hypothetical protein
MDVVEAIWDKAQAAPAPAPAGVEPDKNDCRRCKNYHDKNIPGPCSNCFNDSEFVEMEK